MIELLVNCIDDIMFLFSMVDLGNYYFMKVIVGCVSYYFIIVIKDYMYWFYVDDLCIRV